MARNLADALSYLPLLKKNAEITVNLFEWARRVSSELDDRSEHIMPSIYYSRLEQRTTDSASLVSEFIGCHLEI